MGPLFTRVETTTIEELERQGGFRARTLPLLVKGAVTRWPAWSNWTFGKLAALQRKDGAEVVTSFQNGLVEQGTTKEPLRKPVAPYLRELEAEATRLETAAAVPDGLYPAADYRRAQPGDRFSLDWDYLGTFAPDRAYLAQWHILEEFPELRRDFAIRQLWPGWRWTWEYVFIGPARTVTGLHYDFPSNWFCQVRGVKEFLLFPPANDRHMCRSRKYDWGATLSDIDITRLREQPREREAFAQASGIYARVEPGDALFVPKRTWHAVVSLAPAISLAVFGLTIPEIAINGGASETRSLLHKLRLYRHGNCTCHRMPAPLANAAAS